MSLVLLIFGGMDTTRNQLGLAMQTFLERPDEWRLLAGQPELERQAVEEIMRLNPTVTWVTREATEDFSFQGLEIEAGTTIHLFSQSAGSDPRVFDPPGFDMTRNGHGTSASAADGITASGISSLAWTWARRWRCSPGACSDPRVDGEVRSLPRSGNTGPVELPIAFTAAPA